MLLLSLYLFSGIMATAERGFFVAFSVDGRGEVWYNQP